MLDVEKLKMRLRRLRWKIGKATGQSFVHDLGADVKIRLYYDSVLSSLIHYDDFENSERNFTGMFLQEGDVFFDVGANVGLFSLIAARKVGKKGRVYAFEPANKMFRRLDENIVLNGFSNVVPVQCAISDTNGESKLKIALGGYDAWSSLGNPTSGASILEEIVPMVTLDAFCEERKLHSKIAMIKIDVEGWEKHVLRGGMKLLSDAAAPLLLVEFSEKSARNAGSSCVELFGQLKEYGYQLYRYDGSCNLLMEEETPKVYSYENLICIKTHTTKQRLASLFQRQ